MNGLFKIPAAPAKSRIGVQHSNARKNILRPSYIQVNQPNALQKDPLDFDNTIFNAVDLDKITNSTFACPSARAGEDSSLVTPKRRKSSSNRQIFVLDMTVSDTQSEIPMGQLQQSNYQISEDVEKYTSCLGDEDLESLWNIPQLQPPPAPTESPEEEVEDLIDCVDLSSSQSLFDAVDRLANHPVALTYNIDESQKETSLITVNRTLCSQYIRRERVLVEENEANIVDEDINLELENIYNSTQYRRDIAKAFNACERTFADMSNLVSEQNYSQLVQGDVPQYDYTDLNDVNWEEDLSYAALRAGNKPHESQRNAVNRTLINNIFQKPVPSPKAAPIKIGPVSSSPFFNKGPFFGLPINVKVLLKEYRGIEQMYDWQIECLNLPSIQQRSNLIYALPTSGGKTLVAEIIMLREIICRQKNVIFVVPYVSIAQEKMSALSPFAVVLNFLVEEYSGGKGSCPPRKRRKKNSIFICTIEKAMVLMDSLIEADRANEIGLVIVDELHMIGEDNRGVNLEILLTKIISIQAGIQTVGMSATIGNIEEIAKFLNADIYRRDFRPVELKEYVKCGPDILEINKNATQVDQLFVQKRTIDYEYTSEMLKVDPDHIIGLVMEVIPEKSCLIFCPTKAQCEQLCNLLRAHLPIELLDFKSKEKDELIKVLTAEGSTAVILPAAIKKGIAYHHSGLTFDERKLIEDAFRMGVISLIICTSTLAAGVNLPAKRVIIRSPYIATHFLSLGRYKQMVGRAGRAGFGDAGESIMICSMKNVDDVCKLLSSPMDFAMSSLHTGDMVSLKNLILSAIALNICTTRNDILKFLSKTLMAIQADRLGIDIRALADRSISALYKSNAIKAKTDKCIRTPKNMSILVDPLEITQELNLTETDKMDFAIAKSNEAGKLTKTIRKNTKLEVNRLGKAAIKAGFNMEKASRFYDELKAAGAKLNILDELNLLYLILLEDSDIHMKDETCVLFVERMSDEFKKLANRFDINEHTQMEMVFRRSIPAQKRSLVYRFFRMLMVHDLWNMKTPRFVAQKFNVDAGAVQNLITNTASTAAALLRLCDELPELWAYKQLFSTFPQRLSYCCTVELLPLMELPAVKIARAKQLYNAGFTKIQLVAKAKPQQLVDCIEYMNYRSAAQVIASAKAKLMEEVEALKDQVEELYVS